MKMLYLVTMDFTQKWIMRVPNWGMVLSQFSIYFEDRLAGYLS